MTTFSGMEFIETHQTEYKNKDKTSLTYDSCHESLQTKEI